MSKRNKPDKPTDPQSSSREYQDPDRNPEAEGDIVKLHRGYVEGRLEGGAPATPQAYARAMGQWQRLPGAIPSLAATDLTQAQETPPPVEAEAPEPASESQNKEQES